MNSVPAKTKPRPAAIITLGVIAFISVLIFLFWQRGPTTLTFEIPSNFSGPFILVEDPTGVEFHRRWGRVTIPVPPSGIVRAKSFEALDGHWPSIRAIRPDGTIISFMDDETGRHRAQEVGLRGFRFLREGDAHRDVTTLEFTVGRADEDVAERFQELRRQYLASTPPATSPRAVEARFNRQ